MAVVFQLFRQAVAQHGAAAKTAFAALGRHWILFYPLLLYQLVADWSLPRLMVVLVQQPFSEMTLTLQTGLASFGLVWMALAGIFMVGWVAMACHCLQELRQTPPKTSESENISPPRAMGGKSKDTLPTKGPWQAFFDGAGRDWAAGLFWIALFVAGLVAIGTWAHTQQLAAGGYPHLFNQLAAWVQTTPEMDGSQLQAEFNRLLENASEAEEARLDAFSTLGSSAIVLASTWVLLTIFALPLNRWQLYCTTRSESIDANTAPTARWKPFVKALGLGALGVIQQLPFFAGWVALAYGGLLASGILAGLSAWAQPILWLVWLIAQTWALVFVCELAYQWHQQWQLAKQAKQPPPRTIAHA